jgi:hypothetical protein
MAFEKSKDYIESIYNFLVVLNSKSIKLNDKTLQNICKLIFTYLLRCCKENEVKVSDLVKNEDFDMKHVYDYIHDNNIELLDLNNISFEDINVSNSQDIERFVLSHIYYIYANN